MRLKTRVVLVVVCQIRFLLLQNRQGKTRLSKWYVTAPMEQEKFRMETEIHKLIVSRDRKYTNFVEVSHDSSRGGGGLPRPGHAASERVIPHFVRAIHGEACRYSPSRACVRYLGHKAGL
jgi:hypothetical protein